MYQKMEQEGSWGDDLNDFQAAGKNKVTHFREEFFDDEWYSAGLTIEGLDQQSRRGVFRQLLQSRG